MKVTMLKFVMLVCVLGATVFQNVAEAQRRGDGPTRADRDRYERHDQYTPPYPPPYYPQVVIHQHAPESLGLINDAANGMIRGCEVRLRVSGWANQLYVNGSFAGNYDADRDDYRLAEAISNNLYAGICRQKSAFELELIRDPYLIDDLVRGRSQRCYVRLNVSGWANQLYVDGNFSGNFQAGAEDMKLRSTIAELILNGTCDYARY